MRIALLDPRWTAEELAQNAYDAALAHGRTAEPRVGSDPPEGYTEIEVGSYPWRLYDPQREGA